MFTVKTGWFWQNGFNDPNYFAWPAGRIEAASQALKSPREPYSVMWRPDIEVDFSRGWNSPVLVSINGKRRNVSYRLSQVANADAALKKFQRAVASKEWGPGKYACNRTNIAFIMVLGDEREEGSWTQKAEGVPSNGSMTTQRIVRTTRGGQTDSFGRPVEGEEELSAMVTTSAQTNAYRTFWLTYKFGTGNMEVKFAQDGPQSPVGVCVLYPNEYRL